MPPLFLQLFEDLCCLTLAERLAGVYDVGSLDDRSRVIEVLLGDLGVSVDGLGDEGFTAFFGEASWSSGGEVNSV